MSPAPPPPPPPPVAQLTSKATGKSSGIPNTSALLKSIEKGTKLKKTVTNDRSAPLVSNKNTNTTGPSNLNSSRESTTNNSTQNVSMGMGGLFANGFPKLKSTNNTGSRLAEKSADQLQKPAQHLAKAAVQEIRKNPEKAIQSAKKGANIAAIVAPIAVEPRSDAKKVISALGQVKKTICEDEGYGAERWNNCFMQESNLPKPKKFSGCKKIYLSNRIGEPSDSAKGPLLTDDDIDGFITSLKTKLKKAAADENFEECVRLKSKLKAFEDLSKKIAKGEEIYASQLPR